MVSKRKRGVAIKQQQELASCPGFWAMVYHSLPELESGKHRNLLPETGAQTFHSNK